MSTVAHRAAAPQVVLVPLPPWDELSPHLGVACLQAYLTQHGVSTQIVDANMRLYRAGGVDRSSWSMANSVRWNDPARRRVLFQQLAPALEAVCQSIVELAPAVLGLSVYGSMQYIAAEVVRRVRELGFGGAIVLGGPACFSARERDVLTRCSPYPLDAFVVGEGERALLELVTRVQAGQALDRIPGVVIPTRDDRGAPAQRAEVVEMDALPFPDFTAFDLQDYTARHLTIQWSRGCNRSCAFCENGPLWGRMRHKSPRRIHDEMRYHLERTGVSSFALADTAMNSSLPLMRELCALLLDEPLPVHWAGSLQARADMSREDLQRLHRAGCERVEIGVESGSDRVLRLMRKGTTVAAGEGTLRMARAAGLSPVIFLMVGFPGETGADHRQTLDFLRRNRDSIDLVRSVNLCVLQFNTSLTRHPERYGIAFDPSQPTWGLEWRGPDGNTLQVRLRRQREAIALLDELRIPHELKTGLDELNA